MLRWLYGNLGILPSCHDGDTNLDCITIDLDHPRSAGNGKPENRIGDRFLTQGVRMGVCPSGRNVPRRRSRPYMALDDMDVSLSQAYSIIEADRTLADCVAVGQCLRFLVLLYIFLEKVYVL